MSLIDAEFSTLAQQAPSTVAGYARQIADEIDHLFGNGYAKRNPLFLAEMVKAAAIDFAAAAVCKTVEHGYRHVGDAVRESNATTRTLAALIEQQGAKSL
jgi:hypothetical protein